MKLFSVILLLLFFMATKLNAYGIQPYGFESPPPMSFPRYLPAYEILNSTSSSNNNITDPFDYHVCGNETKLTDCICKNETIECKPSQKLDLIYWYDSWNPPFYSMNIQIANESFIPKNVIFDSNAIEILQKDKILSGHESSIESLKLTSNEITQIENGTFDKFSTLKSLDLALNFLTNISAKIFTKEIGSTLTSLKLSANHFPSLSAIDLSNMEKLENLDLSLNGFIGMDVNFSQFIFPKSLSNLKSLDLSHCHIIAMNNEIFVNLINLEKLILDGNFLTVFPKSINSLINLRNLNMQYTQISTLNQSNFQGLSKLETFEMTNSFLQKIDNCTFCDKPNLNSVMLYSNRLLSYIHENAFGNAQSYSPSLSLESFSLEACNLSIIPEKLLNWNTIKEFGLGKNPFICNCSMAWLINDILSPTHSINLKSFLPLYYVMDDWGRPKRHQSEENAFKCSGPLALKNIPFSHISQKLQCPLGKEKEELKIIYVNERMSSTTVFFVIVACVLTFILGMAVAHFSQRSQNSTTTTQNEEVATSAAVGFINQNFPEDFDEIKIYH